MKLKEIRKHFRKDGPNWVPKRSFKSVKEIRKAQLYSSRWTHYDCDFCGNLHVADNDKVNDDNN